ncbi:MAG: hypothetical protein RDV41_13410 [Planctomycetota bacterium]|nr:hypothetical protein [Planctomycetota bacterium]
MGASNHLSRELAYVEEHGEPTRLDQLASPPVLPGQNAALVYLQAMDEMAGHGASGISLRSQLDFRSTNDHDRDERFLLLVPVLPEYEEALEICLGAVNLEKCRFPELAGNDHDAAFVRSDKMHRLVWMFATRAHLALRKGDIPASRDDYCAVLRMVRHMQQQPVFWYSPTDYAEACFEDIAEILISAGASELDMRKILQELRQISVQNSLQTELRMQRCVELPDISAILAERPLPSSRGACREIEFHWRRLAFWQIVLYGEKTLLVQEYAACLRFIRECIELSKRPLHEVRRELMDIVSALRRQPRYCFSRIIADVCSRRFFDYARFAAKRDVLVLGAAVLIYKTRTGSLPESLSDLAPDLLPELPTDPYTGAGYIYRKSPDGFVVYSVGENLKDDGGTPYDPSEGPGEGDISLRVPRQ